MGSIDRLSSYYYYLILLLGWLLSACTGATLLVFTPTPVNIPTQTLIATEIKPTATIFPSYTPTPIQATPTPTQTKIPTLSFPPLNSSPTPITLSDVQSIDEGGFSFQPLVGFDSLTKEGQVTLFNEGRNIVFSLTGVQVRTYGQLDQVFSHFLSQVGESFEEFTKDNNFPITIDGSPGIGVNIHGKLVEEVVNGQVVVVAPSETQLFVAIALTTENSEGQMWESTGKPLFDALLNSVKFFPIPEDLVSP